MDVDVVRNALAGNELFNGLDTTVVNALIVSAKSRRFSHGETVYQKGDEASGSFGLILSGLLKVVTEDGYVLNELGPGEVIGEVGIISQQGRRTVTLSVSAPTEIIEWQIKDVEGNAPELVKRLKDLAWKRIKCQSIPD